MLALWNRNSLEDVGVGLPDRGAANVLTHLRKNADARDAACFVAEHEGRIVGFTICCVRPHPTLGGLAGEVEELYVLPEARRSGVGSQLVRHAVSLMRDQGAGVIRTHVCVDREAEGGAGFWRALGWENDLTTFSLYEQ